MLVLVFYKNSTGFYNSTFDDLKLYMNHTYSAFPTESDI